jgi:hypothetical protein
VDQQRTAAPPVVTLRPGAAFDGSASSDASVYARQERVLGSKVYTVPTLAHTSGPAPTAVQSGWRLPGNAAGAPWTTFTATCAPGDSAFVYVPWFGGGFRANGVLYWRSGVFRTTDNGILPAGRVPASGKVTLALSGGAGQNIPAFPIGCLDDSALSRAIDHLKATGPVSVTAGGHSIDATFRRGTTGTAVVAVPAVNGWTCSVDGAASKTPGTLGGLVAVSLGQGGSHVACSFRTPGLSTGLLATGLALALLLTVGIAGLVRTRSRRNATGELT